ncbi:MAG: AAA family ATPase [Actinomyces sp. oral taxon 181]|uniref:AAA family ATPase n=1 Tax=Actinomyces sp. oral taxon 181 TaxID=712121 RepID=UPI0025BE8927|nr:ATP-binding protein [Actinomyces sp. oral taxon 181]MBS4797254.1 AAA family ATPase [Actinomyces sp. oral taxon 181]
MKLTHIAITNWRNFAHIEFDLSSRLFVVGPNSSGKTNLLGALRFLGDIGRRGLVAASEDLGGPDRYFRSGADSAAFVATFNDTQNSAEFALFLRLMSAGPKSTKRGSDADQTFAFPMTDPLTGEPNDRYLDVHQTITAGGKKPADEGESFPVEDEEAQRTRVRQTLAGIRYIHPNPKKMLERSDRYDPDHGTGFFQHAGRFSDQQLDAVVDRIRPIMASVVPEVPNLSYQRMGLGTEVVFYSDTPVRGASGVYSHEQFSEGTLRLLGMLFNLATLPRDTSVVLIEEPETFLQASVVRSLPSLLAEVAMNRDVQMVISTHSPELIDSELVLPSQVLMLRSENGETTGELLSESNDPRIKAVVSAGLPKSQGIDAVNGRTIPLGTW